LLGPRAWYGGDCRDRDKIWSRWVRSIRWLVTTSRRGTGRCFLNRQRGSSGRRQGVAGVEPTSARVDEALADPHVFIWVHGDPDRLSGRARELLTDADADAEFAPLGGRGVGTRHQDRSRTLAPARAAQR
jgi:hypothetical protein